MKFSEKVFFFFFATILKHKKILINSLRFSFEQRFSFVFFNL